MKTCIVRFLFGAIVALIIGLLMLILPSPARAGGIVTNCTEVGLDAALSGGGSVSFNCNGNNSPATISLTSQKTVTASTTIDGGNVITLDGANATSFFLVNSGVTLTLNAITVTQGFTAGNGGCVYVSGTLVANDIRAIFCHAAAGGAVYIASGGRATLSNATLSYSGADNGGSIYNDFADLTLSNATLNNNYAGSVCNSPCTRRGGGIYTSGAATLTNVTLSSNYQVGSCHAVCLFGGGGIYNAGLATLTNVTLSGNQSTIFAAGGGIFNTGTPMLKNTIVADSPTGGNCYPSLGGTANLSSDNTCGFGAGRDNINAMLGPLANNGGSMQTHALLPGSPAINFGTNTGCPSTDQRGVPRPIGPFCDVGAYEFAGPFVYLPLILR